MSTEKGGRPKGFKMSDESKKKTSLTMMCNTNAKGKHWQWKNKKSQKTQEN